MKTVYIISCDDLWEYLCETGKGDYDDHEGSFDSVTDEDYREAVKAYGWSLSMKEFVDEFNNDGNLAPTSSYHYIRIFNE